MFMLNIFGYICELIKMYMLVYNRYIIYRSIYSCIESNRIVSFFEVSANILLLGMRIDIVSNHDEPSDLHP